jgi:hypothetical protein
MATSLTNVNSHPISAKLRRDGPNGTKVIDYLTVMPKVKVKLPPNCTVDANWLSKADGVTATETPDVVPPVATKDATTPTTPVVTPVVDSTPGA